ncbi:MAG: hypothetical protein FWD82_05430 [Defluviitaleaceae bacterium]|nr:hypothetical protein [Defluviitaleaceae bacterium]
MKKLYKQIVAFILVAMLMPIGFLSASSNLPPTPPEETQPVLNPNIRLVNPTVVEILPGQTQVFELTIRNQGFGEARNFMAQAIIPANAPFSASFINNSHLSTGITSESSRRLQLEIRVDANALTGSFPIEIRYTYSNFANENFTQTDTVMVRVGTDTREPSLTLRNFTTTRENVMPGDSFTLSSVIENNVTVEARDVRLTISGLEANGIHLSNSTQSVFHQSMQFGAQHPVSFDFTVASNAPRGTYAIVFTLRYRDTRGEEFERDFYYYVAVGATATPTERGALSIENLSSPAGTFGVLEEFSVSFDIRNSGNNAANNIRISTIMEDGNAIVPRSANVRTINTLSANNAENVTFSFSPTNSARTRSYTIGFLVEYDTGNVLADGTRERASFTQYIGVNVSNPEREDEDPTDPSRISIPRIIVSDYTVTPQIVSAGQEFDLDLTFLNTHVNKHIENIQATIVMEDRATVPGTNEDRGNIFSPVNGSNTFHIQRIDPREEAHQSLRLFVIPDAAARTYTLTIKFEYQDEFFNNHTAEAFIGITVRQTMRIETSEISIPSSTQTFGMVPISFQLFNTGRVTLGNVRVNIDAPGFDTTSFESMMFFGRMQPSEHNFYDGTIMAIEPGPQPVRIVISFENDLAEVHEVVHEFIIDVQDFSFDGMFDGGDFGDMGRPWPDFESESSGFFSSLRNIVFIIAGAGVTAAAIVVISLVVVKKKKAKAVVFDE